MDSKVLGRLCLFLFLLEFTVRPSSSLHDKMVQTLGNAAHFSSNLFKVL